MDRSCEPVANKPWQVAGVIYMSVSENDARDRRWVDRQRLPIAKPQFLQTLKKPAVDHHSSSARLEYKLRAGDSSGPAEELKSSHGSATVAEQNMTSNLMPGCQSDDLVS